MSELSHFDAQGQAHMVDVSAKPNTARRACASGRIRMQAATYQRLRHGHNQKGDVLGVARVAAIQGCKRTAELIPLCHPLALSNVTTTFDFDDAQCCVSLRVTTATIGPTGVEMEALTGVMSGLLTIYDMLKAIDRGMVIEQVQLLEKSGGQSGHWQALAQTC